jgi:hypothetical protein
MQGLQKCFFGVQNQPNSQGYNKVYILSLIISRVVTNAAPTTMESIL